MTKMTAQKSRFYFYGAFHLALCALVSLVAFLAGGCKTTMITSEPPGADIWLNDKYIGKTPINEYKVPQELGQINKYRFKAFLDGYEIMTKTFYESPMTNVLDVIPSKIHFKMEPLKKRPEDEERAPISSHGTEDKEPVNAPE